MRTYLFIISCLSILIISIGCSKQLDESTTNFNAENMQNLALHIVVDVFDTIHNERVGKLLGSGVPIQNKNGRVYVLTANHVVDNEVFDIMSFLKASPSVKLYNSEQSFPSRLEYLNRDSDLAVISFKTSETQDVVLSKVSFDSPKTGDRVNVVGSPLGLNNLFFRSFISGKCHVNAPCSTISGDSIGYLISNSVYPGNSGGPVYDKNGKVIGVISAGYIMGSRTSSQLIYYDSTYGVFTSVNNIKRYLNKLGV